MYTYKLSNGSIKKLTPSQVKMVESIGLTAKLLHTISVEQLLSFVNGDENYPRWWYNNRYVCGAIHRKSKNDVVVFARYQWSDWYNDATASKVFLPVKDGKVTFLINDLREVLPLEAIEELET